MSRRKKIVRNIMVLVVLFIIFLKSKGLHLTPLSAHENSERSGHYGPSEVVHIEDFNKGKYILCKYDKWISCNTVNRSLFFFWRIGNQVHGIENDRTKALNFTWGMSSGFYKLYGIINDDRIKKVEVILDNDRILTQTEFHEDMFLFTWNLMDDSYLEFKTIKGYDSEDNLVFEDEYGY